MTFPAEEAPAWDPGRSLGIIGLIFSVSGIFCGLLALVGAIISTVAFVRSRKAGYLNRYALIGIIAGLIMLVVSFYLFGFVPVPVRPS